MNGILNVYKEAGFTSFDVVAKLRGILKTKKIGHTGTLDPDAVGVLPVCIGNATKLCEFLTDKTKEYETVMLLGKCTDTQDISGTVLCEKDVCVTEEQMRETVQCFMGEIKQIPPMYSALKVNGRKLCDLAREGVTVEREARSITVFFIDILEMNLPRVKMRVACSKGTYIRTLCNDIGERLGCGACMESLERTKSGNFTKEGAHTLKEIEVAAKNQTLSDWLQSTDCVFLDKPSLFLKEEASKLLKNGNPLKPEHFLEADAQVMKQPLVRIYDEHRKFAAIYGFNEEKKSFRPVKMFLDTL